MSDRQIILVIIGMLINRLIIFPLIIEPIERGKYRKWCREHGIVPEGEEDE